MRSLAKLASFFAVGVVALAMPSSAEAASTIRSPNPPQYKVEIEPHGIFADNFINYEGSTGLGAGVRFSIPVMSPGFIKSIDDSIAISFGPDMVHFDSYRYNCGPGGWCYGGPDFWRLYFPVAMQWNFWLTDKWSVFGEPGFVFRHDFVNTYCGPGVVCDVNVSPIEFAFWAGARFHFSDRVALTMRVGFPEAISVGVSFF